MCAVKDVFSNRIVGYSIDSRMQSRLAVEIAALNNAVARRDDVAGCVRRDLRVSQFLFRQLVSVLGRHDTGSCAGRGGLA